MTDQAAAENELAAARADVDRAAALLAIAADEVPEGYAPVFDRAGNMLRDAERIPTALTGRAALLYIGYVRVEHEHREARRRLAAAERRTGLPARLADAEREVGRLRARLAAAGIAADD